MSILKIIATFICTFWIASPIIFNELNFGGQVAASLSGVVILLAIWL